MQYNQVFQKKLNQLHPWFEGLKSPLYQIHDIIECQKGTVVIWSDNTGFSTSYHSKKAQGCGGVHKTIILACEEAKIYLEILG